MSDYGLLRLVTQIVAAHISNTTVPVHDIPNVIRSVYAALHKAGAPEPEPAVRLEPAVPIKKSIFPDYIVCLEDGRKFKMLKRHLRTVYNMTPKEYRLRWGLSSDYPVVAPAYATRRSALAKEIGLGRTGRVQTTKVVPEVPVQRIPERTRGEKSGANGRAASVGKSSY